ncbi:MAG: hypothetical protein ACI9IT_000823 [Glaciecola sp.]
MQLNQLRLQFIGLTPISLSISGGIIHVNAKNKDWDKDSYSSDVMSTNKSGKVAEGRTTEVVGSINGSTFLKSNVTAKHVGNKNGRISIG